jgi:hypothetical protein
MKMIENWADTLWKAWSVRFTALWTLLVAYFVAYPDQWVQVQALVPEAWRPLASFAIGFAVFASVGGSRVVVQKNMTRPGDEQP